MGTSNASQIMTLVNSIIGVSILAMPFCYKECGILLATFILIFSNLMTRLSCHYLLKSAIMTRRRSYEFLAFHAFGNSGKTAIELSIIFLMIGTCVAFFVVMGDLGPAIIDSLLDIKYFTSFKPAVLIVLAVVVVLPLGMLRNVDSLSSICTLSFLFYLFLVFKVFTESTENLFSLSWIDEIGYWKPSGLLRCLPIFSMALSCQTQLFEIFDSIPNATLDRMNLIVKYALNLCTVLYISVGFFGYIAYYKVTFTGNLLMSFSASLFSELIKLGFVLSVAVTFPLVIFPCRASVYSLIFKKTHVPHYELVTGGGNHIPEVQFKCITLSIIIVSLTTGLLAGNIEIVLGLLGSTIGVVICLLFPPFLFIWICNKATTERILAQAMCILGFFIMIMGTYTNLYLTESIAKMDLKYWNNNYENNNVQIPLAESLVQLENKNILKLPENNNIRELDKNQDIVKNPILNSEIKNTKNHIINDVVLVKKDEKVEDKRIEPPIPFDPEAANIRNKDSVKLSKEQNESKLKNIDSKNVNVLISSSESLKIPEKVEKKLSDNLEKISLENKGKREEKINDLKLDPKLERKYDVERKINHEDHSKVKVSPKIGDNVKESINKNNSNINTTINHVSKSVQEKPPLPLLKNINEKVNEKIKPNENIIQRDILENDQVIREREKRDLFEDTILAADNKITTDSKEVKSQDILDNDNVETGFVKNIAKSVISNQSCEKDNIKNTDEVKVQNKIEKSENQTNNIIDNKSRNIQNETSNNSTNETNNEGKRKSIILVPDKLSNPELLLNENIPLVNNLKRLSSDLKPSLRELKTFEIKNENDNRKK